MASTRREFLRRGSLAGTLGAVCGMASGSSPREVLVNGAFNEPGSAGNLPKGWDVVCPNPALAPRLTWRKDDKGRGVLTATGNGRPECLGYARQKVRLTGRKTYELRVSLESEGLADINENLVHGLFDSAYKFNNGILSYSHHGSEVTGLSRFDGPEEATDAEVRLYYRFHPSGTVRWKNVSLREADPIGSRLVTVACADGPVRGTYREILDRWNDWLDVAGQKKVDVALLPEMFNGSRPAQAEPLEGPSGELLYHKAKQWKMYVCASFYEKRGDITYNTAPLYDRNGKLVGTYEKNYPFDPELDEGVTPGSALPVFETDLGKVGIQICYDNWFPEVVRILAYRGADLILYPNAGYYPELMAARATHSGVWIAVSSLNLPAGIWDSGGARVAGKLPGLCPATSIVSWQRLERYRMLIGTLDLSRRYSPAWAGGPMRSAPGGRRVRRTRMQGLEADIARESARWWIG